jgi:hypothetical protein
VISFEMMAPQFGVLINFREFIEAVIKFVVGDNTNHGGAKAMLYAVSSRPTLKLLG